MREKQSRNPSRSENEEGNEIFEKPLIEFEEPTDELLLAMNEHTSSCDKENLEIEHATNPKTIAEIIIEAVQNADDYKWIYNKHYQQKKTITKTRERFDCNGTIKLHINLHHAYIHIQHNDLHIAPTDFSVPDWVKDYILQNLDLFPQVIYVQLIKQEMPTFIRQKQIHYWWSQYMTKQYKRKDDAYDSAHDWLYEKGYEIIVVNKEPA
ncbi:2386_t:CDS:2 [Rhizophagus irregularis]|nr:2386_t:CDS:2 [Rhizophagus irregularis]